MHYYHKPTNNNNNTKTVVTVKVKVHATNVQILYKKKVVHGRMP